MQRAEVLDLFRQLAVELLDLEPDQIRADASFKDDLDVDSLSLVEYTMAVEDKLGISLPEDEVAPLKTIGEFADLVAAKTEAAA